MRRSLFTFNSMIAMLLLFTQAVFAGNPKVLVSSQMVTLNNQSKTELYVSEVGGNTATPNKPINAALKTAVQIPSSPLPGTPFQNDDAALAWVKQDVEGAAQSKSQAALAVLNAAAQQEGANSAVLIYSREVNVLNAKGQAEKRIVSASWIKPIGGTVNSTGYKISPSVVVGLLYVKYDQKQIAQGLAPEWRPATAGYITYQKFLFDAQNPTAGFSPVGSPVVENANGAYDEAPNAPDAGLQNLVNQWLPAKLSATKTNTAMVDYGRTLEPVYDQLPDGSFVARMAVQVTKREASFACSANRIQYKNDGAYGATLNDARDLYMVSAGQLSFVKRTNNQRIAQPHTYSWTVQYAVGTQLSNLSTVMAKKIINPFAQTQAQAVVYDYDNDTVNGLPVSRYIHIAPLNIVMQNGNDPNFYMGQVPGYGFACANTSTGELWINGAKVSWSPWYICSKKIIWNWGDEPIFVIYSKVFRSARSGWQCKIVAYEAVGLDIMKTPYRWWWYYPNHKTYSFLFGNKTNHLTMIGKPFPKFYPGWYYHSVETSNKQLMRPIYWTHNYEIAPPGQALVSCRLYYWSRLNPQYVNLTRASLLKKTGNWIYQSWAIVGP